MNGAPARLKYPLFLDQSNQHDPRFKGNYAFDGLLIDIQLKSLRARMGIVPLIQRIDPLLEEIARAETSEAVVSLEVGSKLDFSWENFKSETSAATDVSVG
jgi:hypothetical protein